MEEFTVKKIGEVIAFAEIGLETFDRGRAAFEEVFGEDGFYQITRELKNQETELKDLVARAGEGEAALRKADGTKEKLRNMQDTYIGDEWDNPSELLEWSGFFQGAAIVHWKIVSGAAKKMNDTHLVSLAGSAINFYNELLKSSGDLLEEMGKNQS